MSDAHTGFILIGVGGGGCRVAAAAAAHFGAGLRAIGFDSDALAGRDLPGMRCVLLGVPRLDGHGCGGDAVLGRTAAQDDGEAIRKALAGVRTAVVVTTLGGGFGGGATPELLRVLRDMGAHTLCFATLPFACEGRDRRAAADRVLPLIEENADAWVAVALDDLFADAGEAALGAAQAEADRLLAAGLTLFWRLLATPGFIPLGVDDLHALLRQSAGRCSFAVSVARDQGRGAEAVTRLTHSALLRRGEGFGGAQAVALGVIAGPDLCLAELTEIMSRIRTALPDGCHLRMGTVLDPREEGQVQLVAMVFENWRGDTPAVPAAGPESDGLLTAVPRTTRAGSSAKPSKLSFGATGRGRFRNVEPTLRGGEDLDIPTYLRRYLTLDR